MRNLIETLLKIQAAGQNPTTFTLDTFGTLFYAITEHNGYTSKNLFKGTVRDEKMAMEHAIKLTNYYLHNLLK